MIIQLVTIDDKVLYELPKSEMFPDYVSVLREAIKLQVNLDQLLVESRIINNVVWHSFNIGTIHFRNSIITNNLFENCTGTIECSNCDLDRLKIKKSNLETSNFYNCKITNLSFRTSESYHFIFEHCNLTGSVFKKNNLSSFWFNFCQLSNSRIEDCDLKYFHFKNSNENDEWYNDLIIKNCRFKESIFESKIDLSKLIIWNINYEEIDFEEGVIRFVDILGKYCKVIICTYSNILWWSHRYKYDDDILYRHTFNEFIDEVQNNFPTTEVYPEMDDNEEESELLAICEYLKYWIKYNSINIS